MWINVLNIEDTRVSSHSVPLWCFSSVV